MAVEQKRKFRYLGIWYFFKLSIATPARSALTSTSLTSISGFMTSMPIVSTYSSTSSDVLDCESIESTQLSLSQSFNCTPGQLHKFIADRSPLEYFEHNWDRLPMFGEWYYQKLIQHFGRPRMPSEICWFHGTRVPKGTTFTEGLLPLGEQIPRLMDMLVEALENDFDKQSVKSAFERRGGYAFHFANKLNDSIHWGPYAFLVKDVVTSRNSLGQHDYLAMPEIIEDLCEEVKNANGLELLSQFREKLQPVIVKFKAPAGDSAEYALSVAICYLNSVVHEGQASSNSVWCFDGKGNAVPPRDILKVEEV